MGDDTDSTDEDFVVSLNATARFICVSLGLAGLGLGVLAVFKTVNQAGTVALLVTGAFLMVLGMVGRLPDRASVGNTNWEYRRLSRLLKSDDLEVQFAVAEEVLSGDSERPRTRQHVLPAPLVRQASRVMRRGDAIRNLSLIAMTSLLNVDVEISPTTND